MTLKPPPMSRLKKYGLNTLDWLKQMAHQSDKCAICKRSFTKSRRPHNDHRHNDGLYRGLLCEPCNTMLGVLHDDADWCSEASWYLRHPPALEAIGVRYAQDSPPRKARSEDVLWSD